MEEGKPGLEFSYGDADRTINVFLPRVDSSSSDIQRLAAPSPVFTLENIFKFSDQVMQDRQLFLNRKAYLTRYVKLDQGDGKEDPSKALMAESGERDELPPIKVVQLAFNSSRKIASPDKEKRFNERLKEHVAPIRKPRPSSEDQPLDIREDDRTPRFSSRPDSMWSMQRARTFVQDSNVNPISRRSPKRDLIFFNRRHGEKSNVGLEKIETLNLYPRQDTKFVLNKQRSMWIPKREKTLGQIPGREIASVPLSRRKAIGARSPQRDLSSVQLKFGSGNIPLRPSSKPMDVWGRSPSTRQSRVSNISIQDMDSMSDVTGPYKLSRQKTFLSNVY